MTIKVALAGYGHWGTNYLRNLQLIDTAEIAYVCDPSPLAHRRVQKLFPHIQTVTDIGVVLSDEEVDAVIISTPAATHYELTKKALLAGKHVLVEKPLALSVEDAEELASLSQDAKKTLMVGHTFLYNPAVRKMKDCIDRGILGKIYYLQAARTHLGLIRNDVSAVWDLAPHDISIFCYLLGREPLKVSAVGTGHLNPKLEDLAFINLFFGDDVLGNIHISWVDSNKLRQVAVIGSKARVLFDDLNPLEKIRIFEKGVSLDKPYSNFGEFQLLLRDGDILSPKVEAEEPLRNVCLEFLDCIRTGRKPLSDAANGLQVVRTMCAIQKSIQAEGQPVLIGKEPAVIPGRED
ncbi:MAG: Gfo/Idh/MocA family oxidoreductase [Candidatus Omnitrophica bacterium]|nr:Gfo/Idh/MocA family oxidoreductase [Candidatus Omnitrophota bacterium]